MSAFNPEQFEQMVVEGENQVAYIPIPEGDYMGYIESYEFKAVQIQNEERVTLNISWIIPDEDLASQLGMDELRVRQTIWLDMTADGGLDYGTNKNVQLGRLRAALGLNVSGFQWPQLNGQQGLLSLKQRQDKNDPSIIYNDVAKVVHIDNAG